MTAEEGTAADISLQILWRTLRDDPRATGLQQALAAATENLEERFAAGESVSTLVRLRAELVDQVLRQLWQRHTADLIPAPALVAVGGYGRGELHPHSDVDIMVLVGEKLSSSEGARIAKFFAALWDIGLEVGNSVRSITECCAQAATDITVATTLLEARLVDGPALVFAAMQQAMETENFWPSQAFFAAKQKEQQQRHRRYEDTAYQLEPNVKGSPGGLRDIQMIGWIAKRHFATANLDDLVTHKLLTSGQLNVLKEGREFLWRVRFGLHILTGRREDRLLFDHQTKLAEMLGYEDASFTLAVEQLMQHYYRTVMALSRLNEMVLQLFEEAILLDSDAIPDRINSRFQVKNGFLQTSSDDVFVNEPSALLELFLLLQQHDNIRGVSAYTIGLIRRNLHLIDAEFRRNPRNHKVFLAILRAPAGVTHELRRMNLYGVLGLYIPSFGRIVGRMQYDLFHAYTVDQHTLFVVSNLRRFALTRFNHEHPHCSPLMQSFEKPEIVYLAGLFHDIAKGRGGDHSELGAQDAETFCIENGMSRYEARTVAWLVRHHLVLSMTAQKKDISDPKVINEFAALVRDKTHLDYLYVLTVADVKGTNPKLWNSWKASLFRELYVQTARALRRGLENPIDRDLLISETKTNAHKTLQKQGVESDIIDETWTLFTPDYYLRYSDSEIAWHTQLIATTSPTGKTSLLDVRLQAEGDGIEAALYTPRARRTFAHATAVLGELGMTIVDVRIVPLANGFSFDNYVFMELDQRIEVDPSRLSRIRDALQKVVDDDTADTTVMRSPPRKARMFETKSAVSFGQDVTNNRTVMELVTADRPGLLSIVGQLFVNFDIDIEAAKILTVGERAEDVFYISDVRRGPLDDATCDELHDCILAGITVDS